MPHIGLFILADIVVGGIDNLHVCYWNYSLLYGLATVTLDHI